MREDWFSLSPKGWHREGGLFGFTAPPPPFLPWKEHSVKNPKSSGSLKIGWGPWFAIHFILRTESQLGRGWTQKDSTSGTKHCTSHLGTHSPLPWLGSRQLQHRNVHPRSKASAVGWLNSLLLTHLTEKNLGTTGVGRKTKWTCLSQICAK